MDSFSRRVYLTRIRDFVETTQFPASRADILTAAGRKNTPSDIMTDLTHLKADRFASLDEVVAAIDVLRFGTAAH